MRAPVVLSVLVLAGCAAGRPPAPHEPVPAPDEPPAEAGPPRPALAVWDFLRARYDADGNGRIEPGEHTRGEQAFARLDADHDGVVTTADFDDRWDGVPRVENFVYGEGGPELGDPAPAFRLPTTDGHTIELAAFHGRKPVVLVFGSFT